MGPTFVLEVRGARCEVWACCPPQVPFHKDCGDDSVCISDLVLEVRQLPAAQ